MNLFPAMGLYSSLYHIIMPKGACACGLVHCFSACFRGGLGEHFTCKKDREKYKVCVHASMLFECGCVHCGECVVLTASGDCQVGYKETVMTALLLPG